MFQELPCGLASEYFPLNCNRDRRLHRSAQFRSGQWLPSAAFGSCDERFPTRLLDVRLPVPVCELFQIMVRWEANECPASVAHLEDCYGHEEYKTPEMPATTRMTWNAPHPTPPLPPIPR